MKTRFKIIKNIITLPINLQSNLKQKMKKRKNMIKRNMMMKLVNNLLMFHKAKIQNQLLKLKNSLILIKKVNPNQNYESFS